jgi:lipoprotein-anchoring transpeptidase ErfK/SrfK
LVEQNDRKQRMRVAIKLVITLLAIGLVARASARHPTVVINLTEQAAYLIEDGRVNFISPIASGKLGWGTPTGNFRVIKKDANHQSGSFGLINDSAGRTINTKATPGSPVPPGCHYQPAPMPYFMEFAQNFGMHAGYLPGFPASHGCVRMPKDLAADFFARVQVGTPVKIIGSTRNVTRVRKAIPLVQPGNSAYAAATPRRDRHAGWPRI